MSQTPLPLTPVVKSYLAGNPVDNVLFDLSSHNITNEVVFRNLAPSELITEAIKYEDGSTIADSGALIAYSGGKTGRSPFDKRVVKNEDSENNIWWGKVNVPVEEDIFSINRERSVDYLNICDRLYVVDAFAGWDPNYRLKIRVICSRPYHALFMWNMLIRPTDEELENFGEPDFTIYNAGKFPANKRTTGHTSKTTISLNLEQREMVILGTEYAGEMKKGIFTVMNYLMPKANHLSMHCSATADRTNNSSSLLFGLSGTGKTTLSADPKRLLIGDDEHVWTDSGVFNIEGGCYAKAVNLTKESEPDIFNALKFGAVLENVVYDKDHHVDFTNTTITENTRGAYPLDFIENAKIPAIADHPTDIIFLTCDAFGVLPPVSKLTTEQAMYHFISGYTAKIPGTEQGIAEPIATFSACFGAPFLMWHPAKYAELLAEKMKDHSVNVWLVNTGWCGGSYGTGSRISLKYSRAIIDAIHTGVLKDAPTKQDEIFGLNIVQECPEVPADVLNPVDLWEDKASYEQTAQKLVSLFQENFKTYADGVDSTIAEKGKMGV